MRILLLGPERQWLIEFITSFGDEVIRTEEPLNAGLEILKGADFIVSYGYRFVLKGDVLGKFRYRISTKNGIDSGCRS